MSKIKKEDVINVANSYKRTLFKPTELQISEIVQTVNECSDDFGVDNFSEAIEQCFYNMNVKQEKKERLTGFWIEQLHPLIEEFGEGEPLDGDDVDRMVEIIRCKINLHQGNITEKEYNLILG